MTNEQSESLECFLRELGLSDADPTDPMVLHIAGNWDKMDEMTRERVREFYVQSRNRNEI